MQQFKMYTCRHIFLFLLCFGFIESNAQWEFVGSPESCDPQYFDSEGDTMLLLTTGGLFYSMDTGSSWLPVRIPDTIHLYEEIQIEKGALYLTSSRKMEERTVRDLFRSDDWGVSWVKVNDKLNPFEWLRQLVIKSDTCYYITRDNIHISYDKGEHFTLVFPSTGEYSEFDIHHHKLYAKVSKDNNNYLLRSSDDGMTWDTLDKTTENIFISDVHSIDDMLWKIKFFNGSHYCRIEKSLDDGDTWITTGIIDNLLHGFFDRSPRKIIGKTGQLYVITELSGLTIYHSEDGGINWTETSNHSSYPDIYFSQARLYFISYQGFYASQDHGVSSDRITKGILAATVEDIAVSKSSLWVSCNSDIYSLKKESSDWQFLEEHYEVKATRDGHLLAIADQKAYVSNDQGEHWTEITYQDLGLDFPYGMHYAMCAGDVMYISTTNYDLFYSTDYGENWNASDKSFGYSFNYNGKYLLEIDSYVLTSDNGFTWDPLPKPEHPELHFFLDFVYWMDPYYFTGSNNLLLRLHKDSTTWEEFYEPASDVYSHPASLLSHDDVLFITVFGKGVFGSKDHGNSWYAINEGLTNLKSIMITKDDDFLYLGTEGGVWKRPLNELTVALSDPEPIQTGTRECIIARDVVTFHIPDVLTGTHYIRLIASDGTLQYEEKLESGSHEIQLKDHVPGLYFLHILSPSGNEVRRVFKIE